MNTIEYTTWLDAVQAVWPGVTEDVALDLLWETTSYPIGSPAAVLSQLHEYHDKSKGHPAQAIEMAHQDMDNLCTNVYSNSLTPE